MKRLYDLLGGTFYACDWHAKDMRAIFNRMIQEGSTEEIDLGKMHLTIKAYDTIREYGDRIRFRNMEDAGLDDVLRHNREVLIRSKQSTFDNLSPVEINFKDMESLSEYIKGIECGATVRVMGTSNKQVAYAVCHLLMALRPDIKINFGADLPDYFRDVRRYWLQRAAGHWDAYWELQDGILLRRAVSGSQVFLNEQESMEEGIYRVRRLVVPYAFGTDKCVLECQEFQLLFESAYWILENAMKPLPSLMSYLEESDDEY